MIATLITLHVPPGTPDKSLNSAHVCLQFQFQVEGGSIDPDSGAGGTTVVSN